MIVYLQSGESNDYFPDNKPSNFKIHLKTPLIFDGKWEIALLEFQASASKTKSKHNTNQTVFIFTNICDESILNGEKQQVLRRVSSTKSNQWNICVDTPICLPLKKRELLEFTVLIKDRYDREASFLLEPVLLTLQFIKQL